ncbi:MAG TPA: gamma-glutamylcyclotransferase family protein [Candidatus Acidoferrales bacterium]|nr:gamma-glutamylcyclotransferase family protein [Candidatus Acidoferrales bacterium]
MPAPATWYFAYASNMNSAQMRTRAEVLEEHRGKLENYELVFNRKARGGVATANIRQAPGKVVEGVLYRIPESAFRNLDRYEGAPQQYRRIEVTVSYDEGKKTGAQVYIATKVDKGLRPAPHYLQTILDGAAEHEFPAEYVEKIKEAAQGG